MASSASPTRASPAAASTSLSPPASIPAHRRSPRPGISARDSSPRDSPTARQVRGRERDGFPSRRGGPAGGGQGGRTACGAAPTGGGRGGCGAGGVAGGGGSGRVACRGVCRGRVARAWRAGGGTRDEGGRAGGSVGADAGERD